MYYIVCIMKKTIQTKLEEEDYKELIKEANKTGHTLSSLIRFIIKRFIKNQKE